MREINWSNNIIIMEKCKDDLQREFYIQMTKRYGWTKRILTNFIEAQTYEKYLLNQTNFDLTLSVEQRVQAKLEVYDEIEKNQIFGTKEIKEILDCSPSTARAVMTKFRDMKVVKAVNGKGKGKYVFIE